MSEDLRRKLKAARDKLGLSQSKMAAQLGVPRRTIIAWENNETTPRPFTLQALEEKIDALLVGK